MIKFETIVSEKPQKSTWEYLELFLNEDYTKRVMIDQGLVNRNHDTKAKHIKFCLQQAKEFFEAADSVSIKTSPSIIYYGMIDLAATVILLKHPCYTLERFPSSHGYTKLLSSIATDPILTFQCKVAKSAGTIHNFAQFATKDRFKYLYYGKTINLGLIKPGVPIYDEIDHGKHWLQIYKNFPLSINDLLSLIPDLFFFFKHSNKFELNLYPGKFRFIEELVKDGGYFELFFDNFGRQKDEFQETVEEYLNSCFPTNYWSIEGINEKTIYCKRFAQKDERIKFPEIRQTVNGELFFLKVLPQRPMIPEVCIHYTLMYLLSNLVRYYPQPWVEKLEVDVEVTQVINKLIEITKRKFPNLVLNELLDKSVEFVISR